MGRDLTQIAALLIGVALVALIVGRADQSSKVIATAAGGFNDLLKTVTLQSGFGSYIG